jgi:hypothetical protein
MFFSHKILSSCELKFHWNFLIDFESIFTFNLDFIFKGKLIGNFSLNLKMTFFFFQKNLLACTHSALEMIKCNFIKTKFWVESTKNKEDESFCKSEIIIFEWNNESKLRWYASVVDFDWWLHLMVAFILPFYLT